MLYTFVNYHLKVNNTYKRTSNIHAINARVRHQRALSIMRELLVYFDDIGNQR